MAVLLNIVKNGNCLSQLILSFRIRKKYVSKAICITIIYIYTFSLIVFEVGFTYDNNPKGEYMLTIYCEICDLFKFFFLTHRIIEFFFQLLVFIIHKKNMTNSLFLLKKFSHTHWQ